jgi:hypothetical protein
MLLFSLYGDLFSVDDMDVAVLLGFFLNIVCQEMRIMEQFYSEHLAKILLCCQPANMTHIQSKYSF